MDDIVQYFVECLLNVKNDNSRTLEINNGVKISKKRFSNLSFEKKYLIHQNINYYLNKKFDSSNLEFNFNKYTY